MSPRIAKLIKLMTEYDRGDIPRILHLLKVHNLAATIGKLEGLCNEEQGILEAAAVVHDIGIHIAERKYGSSAGKYQEKEGPAEAINLLERVGDFSKKEMERIAFLVGHHHTYNHIDGMDYQILIEADFLVNIQEDEIDKPTQKTIRDRIFRTRVGRQFFDALYGENEWQRLNGDELCKFHC